MGLLDTHDSQEFVFYYARAHIALQHILPKMQLKMGRYSQTNDPRERKDWGLSVKMAAINDGDVRNDIADKAWDEQRRSMSHRQLKVGGGRMGGLTPHQVYHRPWGFPRQP